MNPHDLNNVRYIMSLNDDQFNEWADSLTDDDLQYAMELLRAARLQNVHQELELMDEVEDLTEAKNVLAKFML